VIEPPVGKDALISNVDVPPHPIDVVPDIVPASVGGIVPVPLAATFIVVAPPPPTGILPE
jgi:hypothetical protein